MSKPLNIEAGTKGYVSFGGEAGHTITKNAIVIAIYKNNQCEKVFACLIDYGNFQAVVSDFDAYGLVRPGFLILFRFEVEK